MLGMKTHPSADSCKKRNYLFLDTHSCIDFLDNEVTFGFLFYFSLFLSVVEPLIQDAIWQGVVLIHLHDFGGRKEMIARLVNC